MMQRIFDWVARSLLWLAGIIHLSYNEVNIIVYYGLIPFSWSAMIDRLYGFHWLKLIYAGLFTLVLITRKDFHAFCDRLFELSARFLCSFEWCGLNYVGASVVFCVIVPLLIYGVLGYLIWKHPST